MTQPLSFSGPTSQVSSVRVVAKVKKYPLPLVILNEVKDIGVGSTTARSFSGEENLTSPIPVRSAHGDKDVTEAKQRE
jgi:hypothetical protein